MIGKYILNRSGEPELCENVIQWARWFENGDARIVASDRVGDVRVSTVFVGLDHSYGDGEPLLWETMIFGGPHDGYQNRYTSKADAIVGHATALNIAMGLHGGIQGHAE